MIFFIHYSLLAVFQQSILQYLDDSSLDKKPSMIYIQVNQIYQIIHLIQFTRTKERDGYGRNQKNGILYRSDR